MSNQASNTLAGGWPPYHSLTTEDKKVFDEAMKGLVGVKYTPQSVTSQVVAGMNYRYKCAASLPPSDAIWEAIVEIYKPLNGPPHVVGIIRI